MRAIAALGLLADDDAGQADDRRQSILMAAMSEFAERGFERCTMRDIAHVVGVTAPAIYFHFDSKERLLREAVESALRLFYRSVLTPVPGEPPMRRLEGLVRRHVAFQLEHADLALANDTILRSGTLGRVLAFPQLRHASCQARSGPSGPTTYSACSAASASGTTTSTLWCATSRWSPPRSCGSCCGRATTDATLSRAGLTAVQVQGLVGDDQVVEATLIDPHSMVRTTALGAAAAVAAVLMNRPPPGASGTEVLDAESTLTLVERLAAAQGAIPGGITISERRV